jgi:hypothetical protein
MWKALKKTGRAHVGKSAVNMRTNADMLMQRPTTTQGLIFRATSSSASKYLIRPAAEWNPSCFLLLFGISYLSQLPYHDPYLSFFERNDDNGIYWLGIGHKDAPNLDCPKISGHAHESEHENAVKKLLYGSGTIAEGYPAGLIGRERR